MPKRVSANVNNFQLRKQREAAYTNILLDYLLNRQPFYESVKKVFDMCLFKIDGYITPILLSMFSTF